MMKVDSIRWLAHFMSVATFMLAWTMTSAQGVQVSQDLPIRLDEPVYIVGALEDRYAMLEVERERSLFYLFDQELQLIRSVPILTERPNYRATFVNNLGGIVSFVYYFRDRGRTHVCLKQYDHKLEEIAHDTIVSMNNDGWNISFQVSESEDFSKLIVTRVIKNQEVHVVGYDLRHREALYDHMIRPRTRIDNEFVFQIVANDGTAYLLFDRTQRGGRRHPVEYEVFRIADAASEPKTYSFELESMRRQGAHIVYDNKNGFINIYGHYSEDGSARMNGLYVLRFHGNHPSQRYFNKVEFSQRLEQDIISEGRDKQPGIMNIRPQEVVVRDDGGLIVFSEIVRILQRLGGTSVMSPNFRGAQTWTDFYHEDIICLSISPDGQNEWQSVLHKRQYSQDDDGFYSSFFAMTNKRALHLFYNDEVSNNSTVSKYVIDGQGRRARSSVMSTEYAQLKLQFGSAYQLDGRTLLVPSRINNKTNLVKISY